MLARTLIFTAILSSSAIAVGQTYDLSPLRREQPTTPKIVEKRATDPTIVIRTPLEKINEAVKPVEINPPLIEPSVAPETTVRSLELELPKQNEAPTQPEAQSTNPEETQAEVPVKIEVNPIEAAITPPSQPEAAAPEKNSPAVVLPSIEDLLTKDLIKQVQTVKPPVVHVQDAQPVQEKNPPIQATRPPIQDGQKLSIPDNPKDLNFLEGVWKCAMGNLVSLRDGEPVSVEFEFDKNGHGRGVVIEQNGSRYFAQATGRLNKNDLYITTTRFSNASSKGGYNPVEIRCVQAKSEAICHGLKPRLWTAPFVRTLKPFAQ